MQHAQVEVFLFTLPHIVRIALPKRCGLFAPILCQVAGHACRDEVLAVSGRKVTVLREQHFGHLRHAGGIAAADGLEQFHPAALLRAQRVKAGRAFDVFP